MKIKALVIIAVVAFATCLHAGSQVWEASASYSGAQSDQDTGQFWPTTTTQFTAQIIGSGDISGCARASQNGTDIAFIAGFFFGTTNETDAGTAYSGGVVYIYTQLNSYYAPGSYGAAKVTATW